MLDSAFPTGFGLSGIIQYIWRVLQSSNIPCMFLALPARSRSLDEPPEKSEQNRVSIPQCKMRERQQMDGFSQYWSVCADFSTVDKQLTRKHIAVISLNMATWRSSLQKESRSLPVTRMTMPVYPADVFCKHYQQPYHIRKKTHYA